VVRYPVRPEEADHQTLLSDYIDRQHTLNRRYLLAVRLHQQPSVLCAPVRCLNGHLLGENMASGPAWVPLRLPLERRRAPGRTQSTAAPGSEGPEGVSACPPTVKQPPAARFGPEERSGPASSVALAALGVQDRIAVRRGEGGIPSQGASQPSILDRRTRRLFPVIERVFAEAGYQGPVVAAAVVKTGSWTIEIVKRNEMHRFVVLPKRWIVERTLAWISRCRRLTKDFERHARKAAAVVRLAMIRLMLRRLTAPSS
jgi:transposase